MAALPGKPIRSKVGIGRPTGPLARRLAWAGGGLIVIAVLALADHRFGLKGVIALPFAVAVLAYAVQRPGTTIAAVVAATIICEGVGFGLLHFTAHLYSHVYRNLTLLDALVAIAVAGALLHTLANGRQPLLPRPLALPLAVLGLAMVSGLVIGHASGGGSLRYLVVSEHVLGYLLTVPIAVASLRLPTSDLKRVLALGYGLAVLKSLEGLAELAVGHGPLVEGSTRITFYEPTANWVVMVALLAALGAKVAGQRLPRLVAATLPLLLASLLLSYRRSFWIAFALAIVVVLILGSSAGLRRALLVAALGCAGAIWLAGSVAVQGQNPILRRVTSLNPTALKNNPEDFYRIAEQENVLAAIAEHPITGLGINVPWRADAQVLPVEHVEGREYTHDAALWFWLKLGLLGLLAYIGVVIGSITVALRSWRTATDPLLKAFALASTAALITVPVLDVTAAFTGVEQRFTLVVAAQIGLLTLIWRASSAVPAPIPPSAG